MAAAIAFEFLHPVLLTVAGFAALGFSWLVPVEIQRRRWWPLLALAVGAVVASVAALCGLVPWFGQIHLAAYALFLIAGFLVALVFIRPRARAIGVSQQTLIDCFLIAVVLGVVGARARYVYERWDVFLRDAHGDVHRALVAAADLDVGGAVWYGGLLLATLGVWMYASYRRVRTLAFADAIMPGLIAGLAVGRLVLWRANVVAMGHLVCALSWPDGSSDSDLRIACVQYSGRGVVVVLVATAV